VLGLIDEAVAVNTAKRTYVNLPDHSRLDLILEDLVAAGHDADCERIIAWLEAPLRTYDNDYLLKLIYDMCRFAGIGNRDLNRKNVAMWRRKRWTLLEMQATG
jgi:hypothetical protein